MSKLWNLRLWKCDPCFLADAVQPQQLANLNITTHKKHNKVVLDSASPMNLVHLISFCPPHTPTDPLEERLDLPFGVCCTLLSKLVHCWQSLLGLLTASFFYIFLKNCQFFNRSFSKFWFIIFNAFFYLQNLNWKFI